MLPVAAPNFLDRDEEAILSMLKLFSETPGVPLFLFDEIRKLLKGCGNSFMQTLQRHSKRTFLDDFLQLRNKINAYAEFTVGTFYPILVGKHKFDWNVVTDPVSSYVAISDEAFFLLTLENNVGVWREMALHQ